MTRLRDLEQHRHGLVEIRDILNSMKTLAYMETRKLTRFLDAQNRVVKSIEEAAADLLQSYPETLPEVRESTALYLVIGTERGFCGDFNRSLLRRLETVASAEPKGAPLILAVGHRLCALLQDDARVAALVEGASVAEEVPRLLHEVVKHLTELQHHGGLVVFCVFHASQDEITVRRLLPPFQTLLVDAETFPHAPELNLEPREALKGLSEHYVFAALHEMLYTSLGAENYSRVSHLEGAIRHLEDQAAELTRRSHALRQEEIVEEIEVMLLSADEPGARRRRDEKPHGERNLRWRTS